MKLLVGTLAASLIAVLAIPIGLVLFITTVEIPTVAALCIPPSSTAAVPAPGTPRQASLSNPPTVIPASIQVLYQAAAARYGLPWTLLGGVGMEESDHGHDAATSSAGAQGLMQFLPATFAAYGVDGDGDGLVSITDDADSIYSAANYLAAVGARAGGDGVRRALYAYNHALWYVNDVLYYAAAYSHDDPATDPCLTSDTAAQGAPMPGRGPALDVVNAALQWLGTPYSWGGGDARGPTPGICCSPSGRDDRPVTGFDCSGLLLYAYAQIGIKLPHLADDISHDSRGQAIPRDFTQMRPGDTIGFSYTPGGNIFHIGLYLGDGKMVDSDSHGVSIATLITGYYSHLTWHIVRLVTANPAS